MGGYKYENKLAVLTTEELPCKYKLAMHGETVHGYERFTSIGRLPGNCMHQPERQPVQFILQPQQTDNPHERITCLHYKNMGKFM